MYEKEKCLVEVRLHPFEGLEYLVEHNICNYLVDCELKEDNLQSQASSRLNEHLNVILRKNEAHCHLANFLHRACFSPVISTFIKAINNNHFTTWPELTTKLIQRHLPNKIRTAKGHINQERKKLQSTKRRQ